MALHHDPRLGFELELPDGWELRSDAEGVPVLALEPEGTHPGFRANVAVTVEELAEGVDAGDYTSASLDVQERELRSFHLIDREPADPGGLEVVRTLGHHDLAGRAIVIDQWRLVAGRRGYGLTCSCWALDYDDLADRFAAVASSFAPAAAEP